MSITNYPDADFTPDIPNSGANTGKQSYNPTGSFRFWAQKVLPTVYDDSLSYYEILTKVVNYLNAVIQNVDSLNDSVDNTNSAFDTLQGYVNGTKDTIISAYNELQEYVNTYFDSLDIQEEINAKLDVMASDGSLSNVVSPFIPSLVADWLAQNITPTSPAIDASLSVSGAGADAKVTGEFLNDINNGYYNFTNALIPNKRVNRDDGTLANDNESTATDYILVKPSQKIIVETPVTLAWGARYDKNKTYIAAYGWTNNSTYFNSGTENVYFRMSMPSSQVSNIHITILPTVDTTLTMQGYPADAKTTGEFFRTNSDKLTDIEEDIDEEIVALKSAMTNLGDGYNTIFLEIRKGYYIGANGAYIEDNNFIASEHFQVTPNETLYFGNPHVTYNNAWYDENDNYISKFRIDQGSPTQVIVPRTAHYCAISNVVAYWFTDVYRNGLNIIIENQNKENLISVSAQTGGNFFDALSCTVGNITGDGDPVSSTTRVITTMFKNQSKGLYIIPESGWMFGIWTYGNNTRSWNGWNKKIAELPVNDGIRLVFDTDPSGGQTANVEEFSKHFALSTFNTQHIAMANQGDFISICHQGYSETSEHGNNILEGYKLAKQHGFNWGETDIKMTSDGVLVCSHDNTFVDSVTSETINISEHTYLELLQYNYYGSKIATFDDVVKICKLNGLGLVVDQIYNNSTLIDKVYESIHRYGMNNRIAFLIGVQHNYPETAKAVCQLIQEHDINAYLMLTPTTTDADSEAIALCNELKTSTNRVDISVNYYTHTVSTVQNIQAQLNDDINILIYTLNDYAQYYEYLPYSVGITSDKIPAVAF